jgi:hypothetical protein
MRKSIIYYFVLTFLFADLAYSQCHCDKTLNPVGGGIYLTSNTIGAVPGDTICIMAGVYTQILFEGFSGTAAQPLVFINCGGLVEVQGGSYGIVFRNSQYFKFTGTGDPNLNYGFEIGTSGNPFTPGVGVAVGRKSSDYELDHLDIKKVEVGFFCKTDPICGDSSSFAPKLEIKNIKIHDNKLMNINGEGFYIGHTSNTFLTSGCPTPESVEPANIKNLEIYNNYIEHTGWDGLQIARVESNADVHHNIVKDYGRRNTGSQQLGILFGGYSQGKAHHNYVNYGSGNACQIFGIGGVDIYNNIFANAGFDTLGNQSVNNVDGVYINSVNGFSYPKMKLKFINNTVVTNQRSGIGLHNYNNNQDTGNIIANNLIVNPGTAGSYIAKDNNFQATMSNNVYVASISGAQFVSPSTGDFQLAIGSPAIDAGINTSMYGITDDYVGVARPIGSAYDAGAYEYNFTVGLDAYLDNPLALVLYPNPSTETVSIQTKQTIAYVKIYNVLGQVCYTSYSDQKQLDLSSLPAGIYEVEIKLLNQDKLQRKLLKKLSK